MVGLLVGTVAFALTLTRTRMYTEDLAGLERGAAARVEHTRPSRAPDEPHRPRPPPGDRRQRRRPPGRPGQPLRRRHVLAVAFLIAGLTLTVDPESGLVKRRAGAAEAKVRVLPDPGDGRQASGQGQPVGTAYRLADGRLVIVAPR